MRCIHNNVPDAIYALGRVPDHDSQEVSAEIHELATEMMGLNKAADQALHGPENVSAAKVATQHGKRAIVPVGNPPSLDENPPLKARPVELRPTRPSAAAASISFQKNQTYKSQV